MRNNGKGLINSNGGVEVLTLQQAVGLLACHKSTLYRLAQRGEVPAFRLGSSWRFLRETLDGWMLEGGSGSEVRK